MKPKPPIKKDEHKLRQMTGRCRTGYEIGGTLAHWVLKTNGDFDQAICGRQPKGLSCGWGDVTWTDDATCPTCKKKMDKLGT